MNTPRLGRASHDRPTDRRQILALSGGGFRGLYTAIVLDALQTKSGRSLREVFDVVAGTSIGGIVAAAIAVGLAPEQIRRTIVDNGALIFDRRLRIGSMRLPVRNIFRRYYTAKHPSMPLRNTVEALFADTAAKSMRDIDAPLLITAVNASTGTPRLFRSAGLAGKRGASDIALIDVLMATAAAPTYFPTHRIASEAHVDGGLIANAPDLVALTETIRLFGTSLSKIRLLSVGTAGSRHQIDRPTVRPGILTWLAQGLVQLTLSAQEALAVEQCEVLLGDNFLRIDCDPSVDDSRKIGLDRANADAIATLEALAATSIAATRHQHRSQLRRFLNHRSAGPRPAVIPRTGSKATF